MLADVGGRMETVQRPRSLFGPDYLRLLVLTIVSLGVHGWLIGHTAVPARDSLGYARYALCLQSPHAATIPYDHTRNWIDTVRNSEQPPGYAAAVCACAKFVRMTSSLPLPDSTLLGAQIASAFAALLLIVPTYLLGRMLFGRFVGFSTALLLQVLPVPARITSDGLSEGMYLLMVALAVLLGVRAVRRPGIGGFILCGLVTGASYLVRPEGLMVAISVGAVGAWLGLTRIWPRDLTLGRLTALVVGVALVAVPYMVLIGKLSAKTTPQLILNPGKSPREAIWQGQPGTSQAKPATALPVFAEWWQSDDASLPNRMLWAAEAVVKEASKSLNYLTGFFAVVGLIVHRRRIVTEPGLWVLVGLGLMNATLLLYLAARIGYVSERHTILLTMLGCLSAASALKPVALWLTTFPRIGGMCNGRFASAGLLAILVLSALPATLKPMHPNREGHKHAGRWLAEHVEPTDCVIDPFCWADWYAGRTLYCIPPDPPGATVVYAVIEPNAKSPHSRLPRLVTAENVRKDNRAVPVYHWPENVPLESADVAIYKLTAPGQ